MTELSCPECGMATGNDESGPGGPLTTARLNEKEQIYGRDKEGKWPMSSKRDLTIATLVIVAVIVFVVVVYSGGGGGGDGGGGGGGY